MLHVSCASSASVHVNGIVCCFFLLVSWVVHALQALVASVLRVMKLTGSPDLPAVALKAYPLQHDYTLSVAPCSTNHKGSQDKLCSFAELALPNDLAAAWQL